MLIFKMGSESVKMHSGDVCLLVCPMNLSFNIYSMPYINCRLSFNIFNALHKLQVLKLT